MKILWFDTETTGVDISSSEIIQIAGIIEIDKQETESFHFVCRPRFQESVSEEALKIQGVTLAEVMAWPKPEDMMVELLKIFNAYIDKFNKADKFTVGGHNVGFDVDMLARFFKLCQNDYLFSYIDYAKIDTLSIAMIAKVIGRLKTDNLKLETIARALDVPLNEAHNPLEDVRAAQQIGKKLIRLVTGRN